MQPNLPSQEEKMKKKSSTRADFDKFRFRHNLSLHIRFYNEHKRLVSNQIVDFNQELEDGSVDAKRRQELKIAKDHYLNWYSDHMIINCFLTMYSHFEECLGVTCKHFSRTMPENGSGLDRFKKHFETEHGVRLSTNRQWSFLRDCETARNVLLHAGGNVALARDKEKIDNLIKRNPDYYEIVNARLVPKEQLLVSFSEAIREFTEWLTDQAT